VVFGIVAIVNQVLRFEYLKINNSRYETDFSVFSAKDAENTKIGLLKACQRRAFNKPIFIMRIAIRTDVPLNPHPPSPSPIKVEGE